MAMTSEEAVRLTRKHIEGKFPKTCSGCARRFETLADYLRQTTHVGHPIAYDETAVGSRWQDPMGVLSYANCACGTTVAIDSDGMSPFTFWRLLLWGRSECKRRGVTSRRLLAWIRAEIDRQVLAENPEKES